MVPSPATCFANAKNPIRRNSCSNSAPPITKKTGPTTFRSIRNRSDGFKNRYPFFRSTDAMLMTIAVNCPSTVAMAAPATSSRGKIHNPWISRALNRQLTRFAVTVVIMAIRVFPLPRCAPFNVSDTPRKISPNIVIR